MAYPRAVRARPLGVTLAGVLAAVVLSGCVPSPPAPPSPTPSASAPPANTVLAELATLEIQSDGRDSRSIAIDAVPTGYVIVASCSVEGGGEGWLTAALGPTSADASPLLSTTIPCDGSEQTATGLIPVDGMSRIRFTVSSSLDDGETGYARVYAASPVEE